MVVKMDSLNFYKPPTSFVVVKTVSPNFHKIATCLTGIKTDSPSFSCLLHALLGSKLPPYKLCGSQNRATAGLQIIFWGVKWTLQASAGLLHTLQGSKQTFPSVCMPPRRFAGVQPDYLRQCRPPHRFAWVKTDSPGFCRPLTGSKRPTTCFVVIKMDCLSLYMPLTQFAVLRTDSPSSYTLYGGQNRLPELLQDSYTICWSQNSLLIALWGSKEPPTHFAGVKMASYAPCWSQNGFSESLHASYMHTLWKSKWPFQTSISLLPALRW